jgi:transposase
MYKNNSMPNIPSRGKIRIIYENIPQNSSVSRADIEQIVKGLKGKYLSESFKETDITNLLYQDRGFMIPCPVRRGHFIRSDSYTWASRAQVLEVNSKSPSTLNMDDLSQRIESGNHRREELRQQIDRKSRQKEQLEQELRQDREELKKLDDAFDAFERADEFLRKAA